MRQVGELAVSFMTKPAMPVGTKKKRGKCMQEEARSE